MTNPAAMHKPHRTPIQIRFKDIDALGHVNNANHATYLELARVAYFDEIIGEDVDWNAAGFILARIEIDYKQPILQKDRIEVETRCSRIGSKSFDLAHRILKISGEQETVMAEGLSVVVVFSYAEKKPVAVPEIWVTRLTAFEGVIGG